MAPLAAIWWGAKQFDDLARDARNDWLVVDSGERVVGMRSG
jgi:hypothetical protein